MKNVGRYVSNHTYLAYFRLRRTYYELHEVNLLKLLENYKFIHFTMLFVNEEQLKAI